MKYSAYIVAVLIISFNYEGLSCPLSPNEVSKDYSKILQHPEQIDRNSNILDKQNDSRKFISELYQYLYAEGAMGNISETDFIDDMKDVNQAKRAYAFFSNKGLLEGADNFDTFYRPFKNYYAYLDKKTQSSEPNEQGTKIPKEKIKEKKSPSIFVKIIIYVLFYVVCLMLINRQFISKIEKISLDCVMFIKKNYIYIGIVTTLFIPRIIDGFTPAGTLAKRFYLESKSKYSIRIGAICVDGWYSRATGSGACSHHGGVEEWLYEEVETKGKPYNECYKRALRISWID